jgi:hypothetical protein
MRRHKHKFELDGGPCIKCGKTVADIMQEDKDTKWLKAMEEDVPTCYSPSIGSIERESGHGFWGNPHSGYVYDKDSR